MNRSLFYILRDFADWTGIPGLIQMINALNIYILFAWLVCFAAMWGVFFYEMVIIFQNYFQYPSQVSLSIESKFPRRFPSITICNQNPLNYSMVQSNSTYSQINQLMEDYIEVVAENYDDIKNDQFGLNSQPTAYMKGEYAREALILLMNQLSDAKREQAGYSFENTFFSYYWNKQPINSSYFASYLDPTYGLCYQFNNENETQDLGLLRSMKGGTSFGFRSIVLIHQYSPSGAQEYLPLTPTAGLRIGVNFFNASPTMESIGLDVKPGAETWIKLKVTEIQRSKKPYGRCVDTMTGNLNYYSDFNYTMAYCLRSCVQNQYIQNCTCAYPVYLKPFENNYCTIDSLECVFGIRQSQAQTATNAFNPLVNCSCFPACRDTDYEPVMSLGQFPASVFVPRGQPTYDSPYACSTSNQLFNGSIQKCLQWFRDNSVVLNIYYSGVDYQLMKEAASYTLTSATNDLGGQMGLWTGISLICVLEISLFFVVVALYFAFGRKITDVDITDLHRKEDKRYDEMRNFKEELDTQEIMDDEIKFRYRELQMRPERKRLERLDEGYRLNEKAVRKAGMQAKKRRPSFVPSPPNL